MVCYSIGSINLNLNSFIEYCRMAGYPISSFYSNYLYLLDALVFISISLTTYFEYTVSFARF